MCVFCHGKNNFMEEIPMKKFLSLLLVLCMIASSVIIVSAEEKGPDKVAVETLVVDNCNDPSYTFFKKGEQSTEQAAEGTGSHKFPTIPAGQVTTAVLNVRSEYNDDGSLAIDASGMDRLAFEVYVEKVDVPFYILISLGIVIVLILVVVDIYLYRIFLIYFKGSFSMEVQYENGGTASSTKIPVRGRWKLNRIGLRAPKNIQFKKIYIQATGKPFVKLHIGGKGLFYNNRRISG